MALGAVAFGSGWWGDSQLLVKAVQAGVAAKNLAIEATNRLGAEIMPGIYRPSKKIDNIDSVSDAAGVRAGYETMLEARRQYFSGNGDKLFSKKKWMCRMLENKGLLAGMASGAPKECKTCGKSDVPSRLPSGIPAGSPSAIPGMPTGTPGNHSYPVFENGKLVKIQTPRNVK
jgi:hypothetical protein